jgi:hypothetical protein
VASIKVGHPWRSVPLHMLQLGLDLMPMLALHRLRPARLLA